MFCDVLLHSTRRTHNTLRQNDPLHILILFKHKRENTRWNNKGRSERELYCQLIWKVLTINFVFLLSPVCLFHLVCDNDVAWSHVTELERDGLPSSSDSVFTQAFSCQALFRVNLPTLLLFIGLFSIFWASEFTNVGGCMNPMRTLLSHYLVNHILCHPKIMWRSIVSLKHRSV